MLDLKQLFVLYTFKHGQKNKSEDDGLGQNENSNRELSSWSPSQKNLGRATSQFYYYILKIHTNSSYIDQDELIHSFEKMFSRNVEGEQIGPFTDLKELGQYSVEILKKNDLDEAALLSVYDFNMGVKSINKISEFSMIFEEYGRKIRPERHSKAKSSWFRID